MRRSLCLALIATIIPLGLGSCAKEPGRNVVGPTTTTSKIPWNRPVAGQGAGQMGMMQPSTLRR